MRIRNGSRMLLTEWMLIAAFLLGSAECSLVTESSLLALVPILCFTALLFVRPDYRLSDCFRKENRTTLLTSAALTVLTIAMLSIFTQLQSGLFSDSALQSVRWRFPVFRQLFLIWNYTGFLGAEILSTFCCWFALQAYFLKPRTVKLPSGRPLPFGVQRWTLLIAVVGLICVFSVSPGLYDQADTGVIWHSVVDGKWNDDHPISYLFFIKACTLWIPSRRVVSLVFYAAWLYISNKAVGILEETKPGSGKIYAILSCLVFFPLLYLQSMIKDVAYAMALFALGMQALKILRRTEEKASDWIAFGVWSFVALSFRHDGIIPVTLTFLGTGIYVLIRRKKLIKSLCIAFAGVFTLHLLITQGLAFGLMKVEKTASYHTFGTPMALLAAVAASGEPIDNEDVALLEELMPVSDWAQAPEISRYTVDMASRTWGVPGDRIERVDTALGMQYTRLAFKYLFRYPAVELRAFFQLNSIVWEIARPEDPNAAEMALGSDADSQLSNESAAERGFRYNAFAEPVYHYTWFLQSAPVLREICVRGGISLLVMLFAGITLLRKKRAVELLAFLPAFGVFLSTFWGICAQDPRYILPVQEWALFIALYAWASPVAGIRQNDRLAPPV